MTRQPFDERRVEDVLRSLPKIEDSRSKEEVYEKFQTRVEQKPPLRLTALFPVVALVTAVFLFSIVTINMINNRSGDSKEFSSDANTVIESSPSSLKEKNEFFDSTEEGDFSDSSKIANDGEPERESLIQNSDLTTTRQYASASDLEFYTAQTFGVLSPDGFVVPITMLAPKVEEKSWLNRFHMLSSQLPEEDWGFDATFPLNATLQFDEHDRKLQYTFLSKDEVDRISSGSTSELNFFSMLQSTFQEYVDIIEFSLSDGSVPEFSNTGELSSFDLTKNKQKGYFLYELNHNGTQLLVPSDVRYSSIEEAFSAMKEKPNGFYEPLIPEEQMLRIENKGDVISIAFQPTLALNELDQSEVRKMLEALLLTSKSFGFQKVQFSDMGTIKLNGWDFSQPISVPVGPNKMVLK
ncbi:hypothetical protein [Bacillus sp. 2205SS5-2]|uniref:hypothetical protein n=1 Tax=Bacillus sp. 2205SS5-2 TaxID=3109031 RepID=UPI003005045B